MAPVTKVRQTRVKTYILSSSGSIGGGSTPGVEDSGDDIWGTNTVTKGRDAM